MVDSKTYFEQWWEGGTHGWKPSERLAEYRLAQDAFIAGIDFACDKVECAPRSKESTEKADNTGSPKLSGAVCRWCYGHKDMCEKCVVGSGFSPAAQHRAGA